MITFVVFNGKGLNYLFRFYWIEYDLLWIIYGWDENVERIVISNFDFI